MAGCQARVRRTRHECMRVLIVLDRQRKDGKIKEEEYAGYLAQLAERQKFHARVTNALPMNTGCVCVCVCVCVCACACACVRG